MYNLIQGLFWALFIIFFFSYFVYCLIDFYFASKKHNELKISMLQQEIVVLKVQIYCIEVALETRGLRNFSKSN
jgi:flagellar biogenesis protein FliO